MSENTDRRFAVGDIVRVTFSDERVHPSWIESSVRAVAEDGLYLFADGVELNDPERENNIIIDSRSHIIWSTESTDYYFDNINWCLNCAIEKLR